MTNLILNFNGETTYSDGTYLPTPDVEPMNNRIIDQIIAYNSDDIVANATIDNAEGALFVFPEELDELQKLNSGYIVTSDSDWVTIVRDRNQIRFVFDVNHDTVERVANIIFKHNTEKEVYCNVRLTQVGEEYVLEADRNEVTFGEDSESTIVNITCSGGTGRYGIHKIRKYTVYKIGDDPDKQLVKRVVFDNAISAEINGEDPSQLIIGSNGSLILDDSYYEVTIEHSDMLGLTQTITVKFPAYESIDEIPESSGGSEVECDDSEDILTPPSITLPPDEEITPAVIIDERDADITIDSADYFEIEVVTVPQESQIYFIYYGSFIDEYTITDYIDENDNISHVLSIKAKPNPYGLGRNCIGYVINAMYPTVRQMISIHQDGNT